MCGKIGKGNVVLLATTMLRMQSAIAQQDFDQDEAADEVHFRVKTIVIVGTLSIECSVWLFVVVALAICILWRAWTRSAGRGCRSKKGFRPPLTSQCRGKKGGSALASWPGVCRHWAR